MKLIFEKHLTDVGHCEIMKNRPKRILKMNKNFLLLSLVTVLWTACFSPVPSLVARMSKDEVLIDASVLNSEYKNLKLTRTYSDEFNDWRSFREDWDIGNPGYNKPEIGNDGYREPIEVKFEDGLFGYKNDRYKQPYWSSKAVTLKEGFLVIGSFYDQNVSVYDKDGKKVRDGYPLAGAVHSRRQFPYGYFETRMLVDKETATHWDAWWAESNNPFSRKYGEKKLFTPTQSMLDEMKISLNISEMKQKTDRYTEKNRASVEWQGLNGQQVYEYDMFEWVEAATGTQWQAEHCWDWYGGYPGVEALKTGNPPSSDSFGAAHDMKTIDELRSNDGYGAAGNMSIQPKLREKEYFTLAMFWAPEGFIIWFDGEQKLVRKVDTEVKKWLKEANPAVRLANDAFNPIQIKYTTEIGQWNNNHDLFLKKYAPDGRKVVKPYDVMYADYFAFYALEDQSKWYGGRTDFAVTDTAP